ncbi:MAG: hypothetical protein JNK72_18365 [Myxococcales bacterium]|nr:hypothetical protein [Myxococcales bacterium]
MILSFAPGASVVLEGQGQLTHRGRLESDHGACFSASTPGRVRLLGAIDVIDVGWWSGEGALPFRCALAALHARWQANLGGLSLRLPATMTVDQTLVLELPTGMTGAQEISLVGQGAQLVASPSLSGAMLQVNEGVLLKAEGLSFLQTTQGEGAMVLLMTRESGLLFVDCTWACGERRVAVSASLPSRYLAGYLLATALGIQPVVSETLITQSLTQGARMLSFDRCLFEGSGALAFVQVEYSELVALRVSDCLFRGRYKRGVAMYAGDALVTASHFHNEDVAGAESVDEGDVVCLGAPQVAPTGNKQNDLKTEAMEGALVERFDTLRVPNPHVTLNHCVSRSARLLSSRLCWKHPEAPRTSVLLNGVIHQRAAPAAHEVSIAWDVDAGERGLVLQATELASPVRLTRSTSGYAREDRPWVVALGPEPPFGGQHDRLGTLQIERLRAS